MPSGEDIRKRSVTRDDLPRDPMAGGAILHFLMPAALGQTATPDLPPFWTFSRDWQLYLSIYREAQWANAIYKATTKMASLGWSVDSDVSLRVRRAREMLMAFDADRGWVPGLKKHLQAYLLTGNGGFLEVVRQTGAPGGRVLGLVHLDPFRCTRTGDVEYPVIYRDRIGGLHVMKAHQVIMLSDMPDMAELWNGVGHCAAERAYPTIQRMAAMSAYIYEKAAGRRPQSLYIVSGLSKTLIDTALKDAELDAEAKGLLVFRGAAVVASVDPTAQVNVAEVPFASLPDQFNLDQERRQADLEYANAIGIDPQLLNPDLVASRALGTGAQARLVAEKAEIAGLTSWRQEFAHALNEHAIDERTTFAFEERDLADEARKAEIASTRAETRSTMVASGEITPEQALQMAVDEGDAPREFLPKDETADTTGHDSQKPEGEDAAAAAPELEQALRELGGLDALDGDAIERLLRRGDRLIEKAIGAVTDAVEVMRRDGAEGGKAS